MPYKDPEKDKAYKKAYRERNREKIKAQMVLYNQRTKDRRKIYQKSKYSKEVDGARRRKNRIKNILREKAYYKTCYYPKNRSKIIAKVKAWVEANKSANNLLKLTTFSNFCLQQKPSAQESPWHK